MLDSGRLRHEIHFEVNDYVRDSNGDVYQDPLTGEPTQLWRTFAVVWGSVEPIRGRLFVQSQAHESEITTTITVRFIDGLNTKMRIRHVRGGTLPDVVYTPQAFLTDTDSGIESIQIPCKRLELP